MTTIYMVEVGEYSDYSVVGVFSTKEKAETFIRNNPAGRYDGYHDVRGWVLDEQEHYTVKTIFACDMSIETGAISKEWDYTESCGDRHTDSGYHTLSLWSHSSVSREHSRKLATEVRQRILRERGIRS